MKIKELHNFKIPIHAQLWISWNQIKDIGNGTINLTDCKFYGPVLQDCLKFDESGTILLDFTRHFLIILPKPYILKLEWSGLLSQDLKEAKIKNISIFDNELGILNKIKQTDKLLLDFSGHHTDDIARGYHRLTFDTILYNEYNEPYTF